MSNFYNVLKFSPAFLRAKKVGEKRGKFQNDVDIANKAVVLNFLSLLISYTVEPRIIS